MIQSSRIIDDVRGTRSLDADGASQRVLSVREDSDQPLIFDLAYHWTPGLAHYAIGPHKLDTMRARPERRHALFEPP